METTLPLKEIATLSLAMTEFIFYGYFAKHVITMSIVIARHEAISCSGGEVQGL